MVEQPARTRGWLEVRVLSLAFCAGVAQLVELLSCKQEVGGSSPSSSITLVLCGEGARGSVFFFGCGNRALAYLLRLYRR